MIPPIHIITPVWGEVYTRCFLEIALPSMLAPGNLPALSARRGHLFHICTTAADRDMIESSAVYKRLLATLEVRIDIIDESIFQSGNRYHAQSHGYRMGIAEADARGAAMLFFNPDFLVADGALRSMVKLLEQGKRGIQVLNIRLVKERVAAELLAEYGNADRTKIQISPRQLVSLAMRTMHPITQKHVYDAQLKELMPQALYWKVGEEGMVARCFHLHPILVNPRVRNAAFSVTIDEDYLRAACPDAEDEYVVTDSDEFYACELSGIERDIVGIPRTGDDLDIAKWAWTNVHAHHLEHFCRRIICHAEQRDAVAWKDACARSDEAVHRVLRHVVELQAGDA